MLARALLATAVMGATAFVPASPMSSARRPLDAGAPGRRIGRAGRFVAAAATADDDAARVEQVSNPTHSQHQQFASDIDQQCWTSADFWQCVSDEMVRSVCVCGV